MMRTSHFRALLAGAALATLASPAFALDGADLLAKLNATYATSGVSISSSNVTADGSTVTLEGAELKATGNETPIKLGTITMDGVEEDGDGGYNIETVSFQDVNVTEEETTVTAKDIALSGVSVPGKVVPGTLESLLDAGEFVRTIERRQGLKISCPEEIAFRNGWIGVAEMEALCKPLMKSGYGDYLRGLLRDGES